jgi:hypothetical protein
MCPGVDSASKNKYQDTPGGKADRCVRLTTYHLHVLNVKKIRGLNLPDPHRPVQACSGTALHLQWTMFYRFWDYTPPCVTAQSREWVRGTYCALGGEGGKGVGDSEQMCVYIYMYIWYRCNNIEEQNISAKFSQKSSLAPHRKKNVSWGKKLYSVGLKKEVAQHGH